jgi:hypothetical protein
MTNAMNIVKFIGAWGCLVGAVVLVILAKDTAGLPMLLSVMSIAFSVAPAGA